MCNVLTDNSVKDSESIGVKTNDSIKSEGKKDAVSAFGSITAQLMDGMAMSLSQFGETGECIKAIVIPQIKEIVIPPIKVIVIPPIKEIN
jgi:hypothetical protein